MSTTTPSVENNCDRPIDHDRFVRACNEDMAVSVINSVEVMVEGTEQYTVNLDVGACDGPDFHFRGKICKHLVKAAIVAIYTMNYDTHRLYHGLSSMLLNIPVRQVTITSVMGQSDRYFPVRVRQRDNVR